MLAVGSEGGWEVGGAGCIIIASVVVTSGLCIRGKRAGEGGKLGMSQTL